MSFKKDVTKYGFERLPEIMTGLKSLNSDTVDDLTNIYKYQGGVNGYMIGMSQEAIEKDLETGGYEIAARTIITKSAENLSNFVKKNDKTNEAYDIAEKTVDDIISDISSGGKTAKQRLIEMSSYDSELGKTSTAIKMNDGSYNDFQTILDFSTSEKYGMGTQISETLKQFMLTGGIVAAYQSVNDKVDVLGNHVKQGLALQDSGIAGQLLGIGIGVGASMTESIIAGALIAGGSSATATVVGAPAGVAATAGGIGMLAKAANTIKKTFGMAKGLAGTTAIAEDATRLMVKANSMRRNRALMNQIEIGWGVLSGNMYDNVASSEDTSLLQGLAEYGTMGSVFHGLNRTAATASRFMNINNKILNGGIDPYVIKRLNEAGIQVPKGQSLTETLNNALLNKETETLARTAQSDGITDFVINMNSWKKNITNNAGHAVTTSLLEMGAVTGISSVFNDMYGARFERMMDLDFGFMQDENLNSQEKNSLLYGKFVGIGMLVAQKAFGSTLSNISQSRGKRDKGVEYLGNTTWMENRDLLDSGRKRASHFIKKALFGETLANVDAALRQNQLFNSKYSTLEEAFTAPENRKYVLAAAIRSNEKFNGGIEEFVSGLMMNTNIGRILGNKNVNIFNELNNYNDLVHINNKMPKIFGKMYSINKPSSDKEDSMAKTIAKRIVGIDDLGNTDLTINKTDIGNRMMVILESSDKNFRDKIFKEIRKLGNIDQSLFIDPTTGKYDGEVKGKAFQDRIKLVDELANADKTTYTGLSGEVAVKWYNDTFSELGIKEVSNPAIEHFKTYTKMMPKLRSLVKNNLDAEREIDLVFHTATTLETILKNKNKVLSNGEADFNRVDDSDVKAVYESSRKFVVDRMDKNTKMLEQLSVRKDVEKVTDPILAGVWNLVQDNKMLAGMHIGHDDIGAARQRFMEIIDSPNIRSIYGNADKKFSALSNENAVGALIEEMATIDITNTQAMFVDHLLQSDPSKIGIMEVMADIISRDKDFGGLDVSTAMRKLLAASANVGSKGLKSPSDIARNVSSVNANGVVIERGLSDVLVGHSFVKTLDNIKSRFNKNIKAGSTYADSIVTEMVLKKVLDLHNVKELLSKGKIEIDINGIRHNVTLDDANGLIMITLGDHGMTDKQAHFEVSKFAADLEITEFASNVENATLENDIRRDSLFTIKGYEGTFVDTTTTISMALQGAAKGQLDSMVDIARAMGEGTGRLDVATRVLANSITNGTAGSIRLVDESGDMLPSAKPLMLAFFKDGNRKRKVSSIKYNIFNDEVDVTVTDDFSSSRVGDNVLIDLAVPPSIEDKITNEELIRKIETTIKDSSLFYTGLQYSNAQTMMFLRIPANNTMQLKSWLTDSLRRYKGSILGDGDPVENIVMNSIEDYFEKNVLNNENDLNRDALEAHLASAMKSVVKVLANERDGFKRGMEDFGIHTIKFTPEDFSTYIINNFESSMIRLADRATEGSPIKVALVERIMKSPNGLISAESKTEYIAKLTQDVAANPDKFQMDTDALSEIIDDGMRSKIAIDIAKQYYRIRDTQNESIIKAETYFGELKNMESAMFEQDVLKRFSGDTVKSAIAKKLKKNYEYLNEYLQKFNALKSPSDMASEFARGMHTGFNTLYGDHPGKRPITANMSTNIRNGRLTNTGKVIAAALLQNARNNNGIFEVVIAQDATDREDGHLYLSQELVDAYSVSMNNSTGEKLFMSQAGIVLKANLTSFVGREAEIEVMDVKTNKTIQYKIGNGKNIISTNTFKEYNHEFIKDLGILGKIPGTKDNTPDVGGYRITVSKEILERLLAGDTMQEIKNSRIEVSKPAESVLKILFGLSTHADTQTVIDDGEYSTQPGNLADGFSKAILNSLRVNAVDDVDKNLAFKPFGINRKSFDKYKSFFHQTPNFRFVAMLDSLHSGMDSGSQLNNTRKNGFTVTSDLSGTKLRDTMAIGSKSLGIILEGYARKIALLDGYGAKYKRAKAIAAALIKDEYTETTTDTKLWKDRLSGIEGKMDELIQLKPDRLKKVGERYSLNIEGVDMNSVISSWLLNSLPKNTDTSITGMLENEYNHLDTNNEFLKKLRSTKGENLIDAEFLNLSAKRLAARNMLQYDRHVNEAMNILADNGSSDNATLIQKHTVNGRPIFTMLSSRFPAQKAGQMGVTFIKGIVRGTAGVYVEPEYWGRVKNADFDGDTGNFNSVKASDVVESLRQFNRQQRTDIAEGNLFDLATIHEATSILHAGANKDVFAEVSSMPELKHSFERMINAATGLAIDTLDTVANISYAASKYASNDVKISDLLETGDFTVSPTLTYKPTEVINETHEKMFDALRYVAFQGEPNAIKRDIFGSLDLRGVSKTNSSNEKFLLFKTTDGEKYLAVKTRNDKMSPMVDVIETYIYEPDKSTLTGTDTNELEKALRTKTKGDNPTARRIKLFGKDNVKIASIPLVNDFIQSAPVDNVKGLGLNVMMTYFGDLNKVKTFIEDIILANKMGSKVIDQVRPDGSTSSSMVSKIASKGQLTGDVNSLDYVGNINDNYMNGIRSFYNTGASGVLSKDTMRSLMKLNKNKAMEAEDLRGLNELFLWKRNELNLALVDPDTPSRVKDAIYKLEKFNVEGNFKVLNIANRFEESISKKAIGGYMLPIEGEEGIQIDPLSTGMKILDSVNTLRRLDNTSMSSAIKIYDKIQGSKLTFNANSTHLIAEASKSFVNSANKTYVRIDNTDVDDMLVKMGLSFEQRNTINSPQELAYMRKTLGIVNDTGNGVVSSIGGLKNTANQFITNQEFFDKVKSILNDPTKTNAVTRDKNSAIVHGMISTLELTGQTAFAISNSGMSKGLLKDISDQPQFKYTSPTYDGFKITTEMLKKRYDSERSSDTITYKIDADALTGRKYGC
jgi:hypothetical protein